MSSPEQRIQTPEGRRVLSQDLPQYEQSIQKTRIERSKKEQADYEKAVQEYEKDVAAAEAQYQKDLAEYNRQIAEIEKKEKQQDPFVSEKARLEAKKQQKLAEAHKSVWGEGGSRNRSELKTKENAIIKEYNSLIRKVSEEQRLEKGYQEFREAYPGQILPRNVAETFRASPSKSLVGLYQQKIEGKAAKAEYQRIGSARSAQNIGAKLSAEYHGGISNIGYIDSGLGTERGAAVKPTPNMIVGKQAVKTRKPLINVKTHETVYGEKVEANPRAFVASLDRQNVTAAGKRLDVITGKEGTETVYSFGNISNVKDESAIALLEFQQQLKTRTAPSATVYKGILEEKGLPLTPLSKKIIDTYSSKGIFRGYEEPVPAKGRKGIISKDGKQLFDMETGEGSVRIGHLLGYKYSKPQMVTELGKDVQGPPAPLWVVPDAFGQPRTDLSGNPILLKSEESAKKVGEKFANKPSEMIIPMIGGGEQKLKVTPAKMSDLGKEIQRGYEQLEKESISLQKSQKSDNPLLAAYQYIAPVGIAAGKSIYAGLAFGVNQAEQVQSPFYRKLLGLKPAQKVAPVTIGDASGVVVLPVNFEKLDIRKPETYGSSFLNPFEKEYQQRQSEYIKKYGITEYASGIVFDYGGLKGVPSLIKTGVKSTPKLITKISMPKKQLIGIKGGLLAESKPFSYDIPYKPTKRPNEIDLSDFGERVGPASPLSKKPIAAKQSDVILPKLKRSLTVKEDLSYKPARRANEIDLSQDNVLTQFKSEKIKLGRSIVPESPLKGKITEPVKPDPLFKPTKRPNEIDLSRDVGLPTFETTRVRLGRGVIQPKKTFVVGKKDLPVKEDFFYKPSTRANEIDLSDFGEKIKMPKIEPEKSEIGLDLKRELKRLKKKQPEFKTEKFSLGGEGVYLSGKRQSLVLVKRQEEITQKKLLTKRKTPLNINWSLQTETVKVPKTGKAPIAILTPREKKKRKAYLQERVFAMQTYEIPLSAQRPKIKSIAKVSSITQFSSPQKIQESVKLESVQVPKFAEKPKAITSQRSTPKYETVVLTRITPRQTQKVTPKLASPLAPKAPTKLAQPQRQPLRERPKQIAMLRTRPPRVPKMILAAPPPKEPFKQETKKKGQGKKLDYIGNVPESQVEGIFGRKEITYGKEKVLKLKRGDVRILSGKTRTARKSAKWFEGKKGDMFGFKNEEKKRKKVKSLW